MEPPVEGDTRTVERTFTAAEVRQFGELSGDDQERHSAPDEEGRMLVQGLLTATIPTQIGSEEELLARRMTFEFHRPVYTGDHLTCTSTFEAVVEREDRFEVTTDVEIENESGDTVLTGTTEGIVWKDDDVPV
ncbi:MAG: MaoC family dehydratase N-terminal domain-containing protein [Halanaeroarchaeum sp.]